MKHLEEFTIHRFRGLRDVKLEGLGQINLLVGDNNSGKTSVLEALTLFCDPFNTRRWFRLVDTEDTLTNQLSWLFPQGEDSLSNGTSEIVLSAVGEMPREKVSARYERFSEIQKERSVSLNGDPEKRVFHPEESEGIRIYVSTSMRNEEKDASHSFVFYDNRPLHIKTYKSYVLPVEVISPIDHRFPQLSARLWSKVVGADLKRETIKLLCLFDPDIEDIDIISPSSGQAIVSVKHKKLGHAPLTTFGDGLLRVFTFATKVTMATNGLLLVDELEMAIHTNALDKTSDWLVKACMKNSIQLFATTHSLEAVDAILDAAGQDVDLVTYRLRKSEESIAITRFNKYALAGLRENLGMEVR